jgi:ethanolamine utilization protein EutA
MPHTHQAPDPDHQYDDQQQDHEHGDRGEHSHADLSHATRLRSIGIDIGSATSHFAVSDLYVGKRDPRLAHKPEVLERRLIYQSPILLTPFCEDMSIDAEALERFLLENCAEAGLELAEMDTGALICTGEAARKKNAAAISERLSRMSGRFVCAAAGHHLEAVLGAHGSGAIEASRGLEPPEAALITMDVGGGTAKRSVLRDGKVLHTAALNVGSRLIAFDEAGRVTRAEQAGLLVAEDLGLPVQLGCILDEAAREALARRMADCLIRYLGLDPMDALARRLFLTESPPPALPDDFRLMITGGLAEYFYGRQRADLGDLGPVLCAAFRERLLGRLPEERVLPCTNGIRATVIGAGQFSLQVSGETLFREDRLQLPLHGVPVHAVPLDWNDLQPASVRRALSHVFGRAHDGELCALSFGSAPYYGYGIAQQLAESLARSLGELEPRQGLVLVFQQNIARTVGSVLSGRLPSLPLLCVDELEVGDLEYLDIGEPPAGSDFVPVVVKSLVFK